jgi:hypothetical protein
MADYYGNAYLTIAAMCSPGDNYGFLGPRDLSHIQSFQFDHAGTIYNINVEDYATRWHQESSKSNPLLTRAWCFQEFYFSSRLAMFGAMQVVWKCRCSQESESHPTGPFDDQRTGNRYSHVSQFLTPELEELDAVKLWQAHVDRFSTMQLTHDSDRLPAISALAASFSGKYSRLGSYQGGLWQNELLEGLCWANFSATPQPAGYHAPTWSWASTSSFQKSAYSFFGAKQRSVTPLPLPAGDVTHVVSVMCTPIGKNPFGEVKDGILKLRCIPVPVTLQYHGDLVNEPMLFSENSLNYRDDFTIQQLKSIQGPDEDNDMPHNFSRVFAPDTKLMVATVPTADGHTTSTAIRQTPTKQADKLEPRPFKTMVYIVPIAMQSDRTGLSTLVLGFSPREPGVYERIGFLHLLCPESIGTVPAWWESIIQTQEAQTITII